MLKNIMEILFYTIMYQTLAKDFNVLIDGKNFFDLSLKNEEEDYNKIIEININNEYKMGNLSDFAYFKENHRLIALDLIRQTKLKDATN